MEASSRSPSPSSNSSTNWCCVLDKRPTVSCGDGPLPCQPTKLFQWLADKDLPRLEDETPPSSFFEVLESAQIAFHCTRCDKLLVSLDAQALQRSIGTQTQLLAHTTSRQQQAQLHVHVQAQTQTYRQIQAHCDSQTQTYIDDLLPEEPLEAATEAEAEAMPERPPLIETLQNVLGVRWQGRSLWSLLKALLLLLSLLHSCYMLSRWLLRVPLLRRLLMSAQSVAMAPPPPPPPPPPRSLPAFIWGQLCRLARKLRIV